MKTGTIAAIIDLNEDDSALLPLTAHRPIGTLPFAGRYRLIDFPLSAIANAGIHSVGIFMPRSSRSLQDHVRSGSTWSLDLVQGGVFMFPYVATRDYEDPELRARYYEDYIQFLKRSESQYTVIMGGHHIANVDFNAVLAYHQAGNSPITVVYKNLDPKRIEQSDWIVSLSEQGVGVSLIQASEHHEVASMARVPRSMGIFLIDTSKLIELLENAEKAPEFRRLPVILREYVLARGANAFEYTGFLASIDSVKRYFDANIAMLDETNFQSLLLSSIQILTKSKNEAPGFFSRDSSVVDSLLGTGIYIEGRVKHAVIFRNVMVHRDAVVEDSIVMQGATISTGARVKYAILDKGVVIGPNVSVIGTAEKPIVLAKNATVYRSLQSEETK